MPNLWQIIVGSKPVRTPEAQQVLEKLDETKELTGQVDELLQRSKRKSKERRHD